MTGPLVGGRYRIGALLGSGGTAAVHEASDIDGTRVAIKLLHAHLAVAPPMWEAFFEEVRAAEAIRHPGVAQVLGHGVDDGAPPTVWIAMEFVEGRTLSQVVSESGPLSQTDAAQVADGLLAALAAAHREGVVHRDVSPANVMLDPAALGAASGMLEASVRLLDFGLADIPGRPTAGSDALLSGTGDLAGVVASVPYASPEQLKGEPVAEMSDVYQAACTLFFALTGRPPFTGERDAVIRGHLRTLAPSVSSLRPGLPVAVDRWVRTALVKDPVGRFLDASAMRRAMPPGLSGGGADVVASLGRGSASAGRTRLLPLAASAPVVEGIPRGARPRPAVSGWVVAVVGGLAIAGIVAYAAAAGGGPPAAVPTSASTPSPAPTATPTPTITPVAVVAMSPIPEIVGLSLAEATGALEARGFVLGTVTRVDGARATDTVLESDPASGASAPVGSVVSLRVASGSNAIPAVAGLSVDDAIAALSAEGFSATTRSVIGAPVGTVAGSEPGEGASLPLGSAVVILVHASTPSPTPTAPAITPGPTPSPTPTATIGPR